MNVYDFDGTILTGDSEVKFMKYLVFNHKVSLKQVFIGYKAHLDSKHNRITKEKSRELMYGFLKNYSKEEIESMVNEMWDKEQKSIKKYYLKNQQDTDVVTSATPRFILEPIINRLGIKHLIASDFDLATGKMTGKFNYHENKVESFKKYFDVNDIDCFYSDSDSDLPMAKVAKKAIKVKGDSLKPWRF